MKNTEKSLFFGRMSVLDFITKNMMGDTFRLLMISCFVSCISYSSEVNAQIDTSKRYLDLTLLGGYTSNNSVPFWMRSNQFGSSPLDGASGGILVRTAKNYSLQGEWSNYQHKKVSSWDWGYGLEVRTNMGHKAQVQLIDAHIKGRYKMFEAKLGRTKDVTGLNGDTLLSSGNFAVSGNASGVPMLDIRISEYYRLPWLGGLFSFKGNFANGYMGKKTIGEVVFLTENYDKVLPVFLHQKSLYGRLGMRHWRLNLYGGINHQVQWGSQKKVYGSVYDLNNFETFWYVFWGKPYGVGELIPASKIGNQLGSIDLALTYDWDQIQLMVYRQNFYDIGAIARLANIADGLNGIVLTNKKYNTIKKEWMWRKLLFEFFYSKDQAGYPWSTATRSGAESYYSNYFYTEGWSYKKRVIGNPLIVLSQDAKKGQVSQGYFISNRVIATHFGLSGKLQNWTINSKLSYARHYGTFGTSIYSKSYEPGKETFIPVSQFSGFIAGERELKSGLYLGISMAMDQGNLLNNSIGGQVSLRKVYGYKVSGL